MLNFLLALGVYVFLFVLFFFSVKIGYRIGIWRKTHIEQNQFNIVKVAEGTVFALLGLLVAFSFSGAYDRFENRKLKIIDEINAIEVVYHRIDLLKPSVQTNLRNLIKHYVDERIATYGRIAEFKDIWNELDYTKSLQNEVWLTAVSAVQQTNDHAATLLFINAINNMLDLANTRMLITRVHPPLPIFLLLIGLGALSSFLIGYSMAKKKVYNSLYTICFVAITAFTLYIIIDLEFPRLGMLRVDTFDNFLIETREGLK